MFFGKKPTSEAVLKTVSEILQQIQLRLTKLEIQVDGNTTKLRKRIYKEADKGSKGTSGSDEDISKGIDDGFNELRDIARETK